MGSMISMFATAGVIMFMLIVYLLSKVIIEKNRQSISMTKILGYNNREINSLYITTTTIEQTNGYKVQISFINLQKTADIAINERTYIYDRCTLQLPPG